MSLADRCIHHFNSGIRSRGEQYVLERRVSIQSVGRNELRALVRGESEYEVVLDWEFSREQLAVCCTCPYYDEHAICKHIWATILAADMTNLGPRGKGRLGILAMEPDDYDEDDSWIDIDDEDDEAGYDPLPSPRGKAGARGVPGTPGRVAENRPSPSGSSNSRGPPMPSRTVRSGPSPLGGRRPAKSGTFSTSR